MITIVMIIINVTAVAAIIIARAAAYEYLAQAKVVLFTFHTLFSLICSHLERGTAVIPMSHESKLTFIEGM